MRENRQSLCGASTSSPSCCTENSTRRSIPPPPQLLCTSDYSNDPPDSARVRFITGGGWGVGNRERNKQKEMKITQNPHVKSEK